MSTTRIYDRDIEDFAKTMPIVDSSNIKKTRDAVRDYRVYLASKGYVRPSDDGVKETQMQIPGPAGAPDIPIRIYIPKNLQCLTSAYLNFMAVDSCLEI